MADVKPKISEEDLALALRVMNELGHGAGASAGVRSSTVVNWSRFTEAAGLAKALWSVVVFVFMAGVAATYFSADLVKREDLREFTPMRQAFERTLPDIQKRVESLENSSTATGDALGNMRVELGIISDTLRRIDRGQQHLNSRSRTTTLCAMHRDTYLTKLADYAAKVRKSPPKKDPEYLACMNSLQAQLLGGG